MHDERALKLARKLFKERTLPQYSNKYAALISEYIDSGKYDHEPYIKGALAAIEKTTRLAAEYLNNTHGDSEMRSYAQFFGDQIEDFRHLPADGGENV